MINDSNKQAEEFARALCNLKAVHVIGVATTLGVELHTGSATDKTLKLREAGDIIADCIDAYIKLSRAKRRQLLHLIKGANMQGDDKHVADA